MADHIQSWIIYLMGGFQGLVFTSCYRIASDWNRRKIAGHKAGQRSLKVGTCRAVGNSEKRLWCVSVHVFSGTSISTIL